MLAKWSPFANGGIARSASQMPAFDDLFREADRLFEGAFSGVPPGAAPAADVYETPDELCLRMDLPGYDSSTINIQVEGDLLTVTARRGEGETPKATWVRRERLQGQVARSFVLPSTVDAARCEASFQHGVLTVTLPKREEAKPRSITVKVR